MTPFLHLVARDIYENYQDSTASLCVVLPNKRGALYLRQHLAKVFNKTIWLPAIISAEDLVAELSGLSGIDQIDLICELYESYVKVLGDKAEPFDAFVKWGNLMLQDFNEADRYLVDTKALYQNLKEIREIENWSLSAELLTPTQQDYILFMSQMGSIYEEFKAKLISKKIAYQGLQYRKAVEQYADSEYLRKFSDILFCGFNALNKAETIIFSDLIRQKKARILWDADRYYLEQEDYEAGLFLRKNFKIPALKNSSFISDDFKDIPKHIEIVAVPKQVGQAHVAAEQLKNWIVKGCSLDKTAIVLADESLLFPLLSLLPQEVKHVNITMEYPVRLTPAYDLAESLIQLHYSVQKQGASGQFYFQDVLRVLHNIFFAKYFHLYSKHVSIQDVIQKIIQKNYVWISVSLLEELFQDDFEFIKSLFFPWPDSRVGISAMEMLWKSFSEYEDEILLSVEKEYVFVFKKYFNRLKSLIEEHPFLNSISTLRSLFRQIVGAATVPFIGEPLRGLQIMGVLETRTLDFEQVMVLGVNEGVLPSGKSINSFIPNDLKRFHQMPLYGDKDAIYAYHFYRLLQRSQQILITYNTETDKFGSGEKSRFITQLQFELKKYQPNTYIEEKITTVSEVPATGKIPITISKTNNSMLPIWNKLTVKGEFNGLSPSALINYKECPLRFYFRYGAGIKETEEIEETAESNTMGSILHESLEALYTPYISKVLKPEDIEACLAQKNKVVDEKFSHYFSHQESRFGKNYLMLQVLYVYVEKLLKLDLALMKNKNGHVLTLMALEKKMEAELEVRANGEVFKININGTADRIDRYGNTVRIIDYKSSTKPDDKFVFENFESLFTDPKYNKMLQLFIYAWLAVKNNLVKVEDLSPMIIPFKKFEEPKVIFQGKGKDKIPLQFTDELLSDFETFLSEYISRILNKDIPFTQTEENKTCQYCAYRSICNENG